MLNIYKYLLNKHIYEQQVFNKCLLFTWFIEASTLRFVSLFGLAIFK